MAGQLWADKRALLNFQLEGTTDPPEPRRSDRKTMNSSQFGRKEDEVERQPRQARWLVKMKKISVVLCTYNRCVSLARTMESLACSEMPKSVDWEVLVVDNNSCDQTRAVVDRFCARYSQRFRYLSEPRSGKSHALNTGIRESQGHILAFTDDDVIVEPTWLDKLTENLQKGEWAGTSGRTLPERDFLIPSWLSLDERNLATLGCFDRGPEACELSEAPFGNNMAFQKEMFERHGGFRTELGPRPGNLIRSEDTEFGLRLLAAGEQLRYEPSAVLHHAISEERIQKSYFLSWWFDKARADIRASGFDPQAVWYVAGIPLVLFRRLVASTLRWLVSVNPAERFSKKINLWCVAGQILECYDQASTKKQSRTHVLPNDSPVSAPTGPKRR